jgi:formylglycine-generating enzyme required for sulfatase activity
MASARGQAPVGMVRIEGGTYQPFLRTTGQSRIRVSPFFLDRHAVTNAEYLDFVKANPSWARSKVSPLFADHHYLSHWAGDFQVGDKRLLQSPVTNVSWFAAKAYCQWKGKRLPSMEEWEFAAASPPAGETGTERLSAIILDWYSRPNPSILPHVGSTFTNQLGLADMHGLIWEWVYDFNAVMLPSSQGAGSRANFFCAAGALNTTNKEDYAAFMRYAFRESLQGAYCIPNLGFRCAMDVASASNLQ